MAEQSGVVPAEHAEVVPVPVAPEVGLVTGAEVDVVTGGEVLVGHEPPTNGEEAHPQTALADARTDPQVVAGQPFVTHGKTAEEMDA